MPDCPIALTEADQFTLACVAARMGMDVRQAAEWLLRRRLERVARQANGRGRALYMLPRQRPPSGERT